MNKLILKFASGRDANKEYSFDAVPALSVSIGRDPACQVVVHEQEDAVSRRHALIQPADPARVDEWIVVDNGSANGLFVNEVEVKQRHPIHDEDVIRLGRSGPTLLVAFDPKPIKATRVVSAAPVAKATRLETPAQPAGPAPTREQAATNTQKAEPAKPAGIGKETLERRIGEVTEQVEKKSNKKLLNMAAVALALIVGVGGYSFWQSKQQSAEVAVAQGEANDAKKAAAAALSKPPEFDTGLATKIRNEMGNSTVLIEARWQIVDAVTGRPVYHRLRKTKDGEIYPLYRKLGDGSIRPVITFEAKEGLAVFGGTHTGSGFVVSPDGFIMTNKHVAEGWSGPFAFRFPGIVMDDKGMVDAITALPDNQQDWSPMRDGYFLEDKGKNAKDAPERRFEGRNMQLEVVFPNSPIRVPARNGSSSARHDVALLKIDAAQPLTPVALNYEAHTSVQPGNKVVQLGYPGLSSTTYLSMRSQEGASQSFTSATVQDVSVNEGIVSKLVPLINNSTVDAFVVTKLGDYIEMNINHSGPGNSGGPIFDAQGKVVALFTADLSNRNASGSIALGVPIRYGLELLDPTRKVLK